jgi:hypothetical protein
MAAHDVCVGVGLARRDSGSTGPSQASEICGIVALCIDIGLRSDTQAISTLPGTVEQAISILSPELPPTFAILTATASWCYGSSRTLGSLKTKKTASEAARLAVQWNRLIRDSARLRGWKIDQPGDLAGQVRIPGTTNCNDPANPKPVTIHSRSDQRYSPSGLIEFLNDMQVPDDDAKRDWARQFNDRPVTIDLAARIPNDLLDSWLVKDPRFKATWFRQRSDLPDQSQGEYDLALAQFGVSAVLHEQQTINLIIHHRAVHKQRQRSRIDYYYRILSISEAVGLQLKHFDPKKGTIRIEQRHCRGDVDEPKTRNSKRVLALGTLVERYQAWINEKKIIRPNDWIFFQEDDGSKPMWDSGVRKALKSAAVDAGCDFPGFGLHSFRRANVTMRQEEGGSAIEASKIAGHATVNQTADYTVVQLKRQEELTRAIQDRVARARE